MLQETSQAKESARGTLANVPEAARRTGRRDILERLEHDTVLGAVILAGKAHFRVWAPHAESVQIIVEAPRAEAFALEPQRDGYFAGSRTLPAGTLYRYLLDGRGPYPDPCSRYQPRGPHGPSMLVDPCAYRWHDQAWRGRSLPGQVLYELHIGAFTAQGTFDAAAGRLPALKDLGVSVVELMPVAECPGRFNWGYDGVHLYAPYHVYGDPEALKRFVDRAHELGLAVILDVVYNHLGPDGNYLGCFSPDYFTTRYRTEWGDSLNFDGERCQGARDLVIGNALYWVREFHVDGFRLDATQSIFDSSATHVITELIQRARAAARPRRLLMFAENEPQRSELLLPASQGGFDLDGMWNDDFHHAARVALTGVRDGYYRDYGGSAQELVSCARHGFLYQGQYYHWQRKPRGSPMGALPAQSCVIFLQNHDQVGNTFTGRRLHRLTSPGRLRALTALLLLAPQTPLLFMGQEFAASANFTFFADHDGTLGASVYAGRRAFLGQFRCYATPAAQTAIPDPSAEHSFTASKLDWSELGRHRCAYRLHADLLRLRREDPVIARQARDALDGAVLATQCLLLRWFDREHGDRLLLVNLGVESRPDRLAEPLLAPPADRAWELAWSSEHPLYDGRGALSPLAEDGRWRFEAECAVLLRATTIRPELDHHAARS